MKSTNLIKGFPGLLNTIGTLLDRSRTILQKVNKSEKWGAPWAPGGTMGPGPRGLGPKKQRNFEKYVFFQHRKDARRNSVPETVLNNSKSLIWSHSGVKTLIEKVSINVYCANMI